MIIFKNIRISKQVFDTDIPLPTNYFEDESGRDWYTVRDEQWEGGNYFVVVNADGAIITLSDNPNFLTLREGVSVYEVLAEAVPGGISNDGNWFFDGENIVPRVYTQGELIAVATMQRDALMATAEAAIAPLKRAVKYGMATDAEKQLLEEWEVYTVTLSRLDLTTAPDIDWPDPPQ